MSDINNKPNRKKWYSYIDFSDIFDIEFNWPIKIICFIAIALLMVATIIQEKAAFDIIFENSFNDAEAFDVFKGLWSPLWRSWVQVAVLLLLTAIIGRLADLQEVTTYLLIGEVALMLIASIVLAFVYPPCDSVVENLIGLLLYFVIFYIVPVAAAGVAGLAIANH